DRRHGLPARRRPWRLHRRHLQRVAAGLPPGRPASVPRCRRVPAGHPDPARAPAGPDRDQRCEGKSMMRHIRFWYPLLVLIVPLAIVVLVSEQFASPGMQRNVTEALILLVFAVGLYIFVGNSGIMSF